MCYRTYRLIILAAAAGVLWGLFPAAAAETVPANPGFEQGHPDAAPEQWLVPKIPGYDVLVTDENPKSGNQCLMIKRGTGNAGPFGNVMQRIDATVYRGKRVRYRAAVRTQLDGGNGAAQLWLRVDLLEKNGQRRMGFFDNMGNRPIREQDWDYYEIVGDIADDAAWINVGMFLRGSGQAWLDDVSLEIVDESDEVTGSGMSFANIGPGLLEISGGMELMYKPNLITHMVKAYNAAAGKKDTKQEQIADVLIPVPLVYRRQVPVTYELTVDPPEAVKSITVYQDTPTNYVAKVSFVPGERDKIDIKFRSVVLVEPSSFDKVPEHAKIPDTWPEACLPWLESTWCVGSQNEQVQILCQKIRETVDDANDVMSLIAGVQEQAENVYSKAQGMAWNLTAVAALTGRGSCTSNANLVAALLRGCNIPARIAAGYPSWSGPLQTHYIVEAYVPGFGWYPIESSLLKSPWPNENQVNVAIIPPKYESKELANRRPQAAGGVPYLSLTEMTGDSSDVNMLGTIDRDRNCDHQCKMVRKFPVEDDQWESVPDTARSQWQKWIASKPQATEDGQLIFGPKPDAIDAKSPGELMEHLTP